MVYVKCIKNQNRYGGSIFTVSVEKYESKLQQNHLPSMFHGINKWKDFSVVWNIKTV